MISSGCLDKRLFLQELRFLIGISEINQRGCKNLESGNHQADLDRYVHLEKVTDCGELYKLLLLQYKTFYLILQLQQRIKAFSLLIYRKGQLHLKSSTMIWII